MGYQKILYDLDNNENPLQGNDNMSTSLRKTASNIDSTTYHKVLFSLSSYICSADRIIGKATLGLMKIPTTAVSIPRYYGNIIPLRENQMEAIS